LSPLLSIGIAGVGAATATAQTGPSITIDRDQVELGDPIIITITGFTGNLAVAAVCGNLAKRGSSDCNMTSAQSERIRPNGQLTLTQLFIQAPPVPCPCLIRVSTSTNDEFAVAPITIVDHPSGPLIDLASGPLVDVTVHAERAEQGFSDRLRSGLGGSTPYDVTVSVRNITTQPITKVVLRGSATHRLNDEAAVLTFDRPGPIDPGQTWTQTVSTKLPAPVIGRFTWTVSAAGAGEIVTATETTSAVPMLLYFAVGLLALDLLVILVRWPLRRRRKRGRRPPKPGRRRDDPQPVDEVFEVREPTPVG
jgi:hypothetical protein